MKHKLSLKKEEILNEKSTGKIYFWIEYHNWSPDTGSRGKYVAVNTVQMVT